MAYIWILHLLSAAIQEQPFASPFVTRPAPGIASKPGRSTTRKAASAGGGRVEIQPAWALPGT